MEVNNLKIIFLKSIASKNYSYAKNEEVDLPKKQADVFVKVGVAKSLEKTKTETTKKKSPAKKKADEQ